MQSEAKATQDMLQQLPSIANHYLPSTQNRTPLVTVEKKLLLEKVVDKVRLCEAVELSLPDPRILDDEVREQFLDILMSLSRKLRTTGLIPPAYLEYVGLAGRLRTEASEHGMTPEELYTAIGIVKEAIWTLDSRSKEAISEEEIKSKAKEEGLFETDVTAAISILKHRGDIYAPKHGFVSRI